MGNAGSKLGDLASTVVTEPLNTITNAINFISGVVGTILGSIGGVFASISNIAGSISSVSSVITTVRSYVDSIIIQISMIQNTLQGIVTNIVTSLQPIIEDIIEGVSDRLINSLEPITGAIQTAIYTVQNVGQKMSDFIASVIEHIMAIPGMVFGSVVNIMQTMLHAQLAFANLGSSMVTILSSTIPSVTQAIGSQVSNTLDVFAPMIIAISNTVNHIIESMSVFVKEIMGSIVDEVKSVFKEILETVEGLGPELLLSHQRNKRNIKSNAFICQSLFAGTTLLAGIALA